MLAGSWQPVAGKCYLLRMATINLRVNGRAHTVDVDASAPLLYVLSDEIGANGPKFGCGLGQCGACTVIVKGQAIRSCVTPVKSVAGADITTLDGLGTPEKPHPIQQAFIDEQAAQCGFCLSGVILTAKALVDRTPKPTDEQIQQALSGVLCRCFAHQRMIAAIKRYASGSVRLPPPPKATADRGVTR
jgi:nicotinate dehydrogenase subunit A